MNKNLLILGAGQYGLVAREIALSMRCFEKIDFLDDKSELAIGRLEDYEKYTAGYSCAITESGAVVRLKSIIPTDIEAECGKIAGIKNLIQREKPHV